MLFGREPEQARLEGLLEAGRRRRSHSLVLHGDAGVGKSALLEHAVARAVGFGVLRVQPLEVESELSFAGLSDLVRPILHLLECVPRPQADALSSALALGPPSPGDRFAAAAGTLSLLAAAASDSPVLVVVDDAHWLDVASREAIVFAGRRLVSEGVVLLLGMRERPWLARAGLETIRVVGLPSAAAVELVEGTRPGIGKPVRDRVVAETGGNPLAILETLDALSDGQLDGSIPLARPLSVGFTIEAAFGSQVRALPHATRRALLVAAANDSAALDETSRALASEGLSQSDLEPAERIGLVMLDGGRVEFKHPLVRSSTYQMHEHDERRAAHRSLAAAIEPSQPDRVAWHLAAAATGPDEVIAAALERAGCAARARGGHAAASRALELAGQLSPAGVDTVRRLLTAAEAALVGNAPERSLAILDTLLEGATEPGLRADIQLMRGIALYTRQRTDETYEMLVGEAVRVEPYDGQRAAALLVQAYFSSMMGGHARPAERAAARSLELARPGGPVAFAATSAFGCVLVMLGEDARGRELLESLRPLLDGLGATGEVGNFVWQLAMGYTWLEDWDTARQLFERAASTARAAAAPGWLTFPLAGWSELEFRTGNLSAAYALAAESVDLCIATGQDAFRCYALQALARVEAVLGHDEACREHANAALTEAARWGVGTMDEYVPAILGLCELGRGRPEEAIRQLDSAAKTARAQQVTQRPVQWAGDLIEANIRCGRIDDAERHLAELAAELERTGQRWTATCVARYRGMLASESEFEVAFEEALAVHSQDPSRFETGRTELCLGQRRRRARRRADARKVLHSALDTFEALGAEPWAEQARTELRATGEAPAPSSETSLRDLTAQELQVAMIVADGATNNETAAALFLSPKTVEFHLHNTYRKLGVRSRTELARKMNLAGH